MLDMKFIRENVKLVKKNIANRRAKVDIDTLLELDGQRLALLKTIEDARKERNETADLVKNASAKDKPKLIERGKELKQQIAEEEAKYAGVEAQWNQMLLNVPNLTHPDAPVGESDADNAELRVFGKMEKPSFKPRSHVELAKTLDLIDFERGAKVAGAKFYFLKGKLALLEQALTQWVIKEMVAEGYQFLITPDLARDTVLQGVGFQPRGPETQVYSVEGTDLSLIGTAEIPLGGYHMNEVIDEERLPLKYVGLSHCFRTEAGAYGRESYGLYRVHQFSKVELFVYAAPEQSDALHEELRRLEEGLFQKLGLVFRTVDICSADLGGPAYRKYDLEAWMWGKGEGEGDWGEVTSTSNCTDYQARRLNVKLRKKDGSIEHAHTLNGTAIALSRGLIAIMEQYQNEDGSITIPEVLRPFTGFKSIQ